MTEKPTNLRLDEILLFEELITEQQIKDALAYQREHGGKIGSHLMRHGQISEADLVRALSKQFDCDGIVLSDLTIPAEVLKLIPADVALARRVIPFDYSPESNVLKLACENPNDEDLIKEMNFVAKGKSTRLYVAAELALKAAIARHYMSANDSAPILINQLTDTGSLPIAESILAEGNGVDTGDQRRPARGEVLLVTDDGAEAGRMKAMLEHHNYRVACVDSADDAIELIDDHHYGTVFIKDTVPGDYIDLIDRLRKISPKTKVRYFESAARLLIDREASSTETDLLVKNLNLFTSIFATKDKKEHNNGHIVGQYVDRLCIELGIPKKERILITTAGYLHDLSRYYYGVRKVPSDPRAQIDLTIKLLDSLSYSPVVQEILRSTYINLRNKYTKRLPIEVLGGNIVTIVDIFCDNVKVNEKLSLDKFEAIRKKFDELTGKLFLEEVVTAFVEMIQRDVLKKQKEVKFGQVMVFGEDKKELGRVCRQLQSEGFRTLEQHRHRKVVDLFQRSRPNMMILMASKSTSQIISIIDDLSKQDVNVADLPTFILAPAEMATQLTDMFERGIEDIIVLDESLELLMVKMKKVRDRLEQLAQRNRENGSASRGTLDAMNLIDLLQALGPSRKTAKLDITSEDGTELVIYLESGSIMFAECGDVTGAEAVWKGIAWNQGNWFIEPVTADGLPEPNNDLSNESILMEGVRLLDESRHDTESSPAT